MRRQLTGRLSSVVYVALLGSSFGAGFFVGCSSKSPGVTGDGGGGNGADGGGQGGSGQDGSGQGGSGQGGSGQGGSSGAGGAGADAGGAPAGCDPAGPQCNNCKDDDGDGLTDYYDPECTGPLDNDEGSYATGIPGDNVDACKQDCFFDGNSGMGDDGCDWDLKCDPKNPGQYSKCPYDPNARCKAAQTDRCIKYCGSRTPNGCDCFGCCTLIDSADKPHDVLLVPTCTHDKLDDPKACPPCTKSTSCNNPCERCEICIDKPSIPSDCPRPDGGVGGSGGSGGVGGSGGMGGSGGAGGTGGAPPPPPPACATGFIPCGPGGIEPSSCPVGTECITGCCITIVP